jgi:hypothetical protein
MSTQDQSGVGYNGVGYNADTLAQQIKASLDKATVYRNSIRRNMTRMGIAGTALTALATFAAGLPTVIGAPIVAGDWRITCGVAALFTLAATIVTGAQTLVANPDALTLAGECVGKLRALAIDTLEPGFDVAEVRKQYRAVLTEYAQVDL